MNPSPKGSLNDLDWLKIQNNFMIFVSPILMIYLGSLSTLLNMPNHVFNWSDLIPNPILIGMMIKQLIDTTIDILRKYNAGQ